MSRKQEALSRCAFGLTKKKEDRQGMYYRRNYAFYSSLSSYRPLRTSNNNKSFHLDHFLRSFPSLNQSFPQSLTQ